MVELILIERLDKINRLIEQELICKRDYDRAVVSILDGMLALLR